ncbi:MAG: glycosyltransferase [Clostridium sp.]|nr:glycosyltransferase [Clostridium sp.]
MYIWVVGRNFPQRSTNMEGFFEFQQASILAEHGHKVLYLAILEHPYKKVKKRGMSSWNEKGVTVFVNSLFYPVGRDVPRIKKLSYKRWKNFLRHVEEQHGVPEVIHVHYPTLISDEDAILEYQSKGTRVFCTEHWGNAMNGKLSSQQKERLNSYVAKGNGFACVGNQLREAVCRMTGNVGRVFQIPNVVEHCSIAKESSEERFTFVATGRLVKLKQFDKIIEAFTNEFQGNSKVQMVLVGGGSEKKNLMKLIRKLNMEQQVVMTGVLDHESTMERIGQSDVLVSYSTYETFGVPIAEAWMCGKPVIVADNAGIVQYWKEGMGYLVSLESNKKLGNAMKQIYQNYSQFNKDEIAAYAKDNFSVDAIYRKLMNFYIGALEE